MFDLVIDGCSHLLKLIIPALSDLVVSIIIDDGDSSESVVRNLQAVILGSSKS